MLESLTNFMSGINPLLGCFLVSMIPLVELRGGVLLGAAMGLPWLECLGVCIIGNIIPIPFLILFGRAIIRWAEKTRLFGRFIHGYQRRLLSKNKQVKKYGPWGLILFVGIPLPGTGAWSGAVLALLMDLRLKTAIPAILAGILLAGIIMTIGSQGAFSAIRA